MANWLDQHPVVGRPQEPKKEREQDWLAAFPVVDAPPRQQRESQATLGDYVRVVDSGLGRGIASLSAGLGQLAQAPVAGLASGLAGAAAAIDRGRVAAKEAVGIDAEPARQTQAMAQRMARIAEDTRTRRAQQPWALHARLGRGLEQVSAQSLAELRERDAQHVELAQQQANMQQAQGFMGTLGAVRDNPLAFTHTLAQSLPATLAGVGAGAIAARSGAGLGTVSKVGIAAEAGLGAAQARYGVYEQVSTMPLEQLQHSPRFVEILAATGGDGVRARSILANELADQVPVLAGAGTALGTVLTNRLFGGDATAKALTGGARVTLPETAKRIAQEAVEEGIQSVPEALASHGAMVQADPSQDFDLGGTVAQGMAAGLAMGAGGHGARYAMDRRAGPAEPPADETAPVEPPPAPAPIEPAQAQPAAPPPPAEPTEAQQALLQPVTITALDRAQVIADELDALEQQAVQTGTTPDTDARQQQLERELTAITGTWPAAVPGAPTRFSTEAGVSIDARYALIDASDLITSHTLDLRANPLYPQELQPRDRTRAASELQVSKIAQGLDPQRLGSSGDATSGAPIIGADGLVESGNARTIAIKRAYQAGGQKIEDYKGWLRDHASEFGLDPQAVDTLTQPVLVRVRQTPVNRAEFAKQANMSQIQRMSASEQALSDAARLVSLDGLNPADDGDFSSSRDFISQFMALLPTTEQAEMLEADGKLSTTGYRRIQNAVLAKAYGDSPTLRRMTESMDDNLRNVSKALVRVAPVIAETRGRMQAGALHEADIVPDLLQAVEGMAEMKDRGVGLEQELSQQDLSGPKYTAESQTLLRMLSDNIRSPRRIAEFLQHYHAALEQAGDPRQGDMLGPAPAPTRAELLSAAAQQGVPNDTTTDAQRGEHRASPPIAEPDRQQSEDAPGSRSSDQGDGIASTDAAGGQPGVETGATTTANEQSAAATGQPAAQHKGGSLSDADRATLTGVLFDGRPVADAAPVQAESEPATAPAAATTVTAEPAAPATDQEAPVAAQEETPPEPLLTSPTPAQVVAQQEAAEAAKRKADADRRAADEAERKRLERKDIEQRSVQAAATFELGQDAEQSLSGQQGIFDAKEPDASYNATYETDLFGNPVPAPAGSRRRGRQTAAQGGGVQPAAAVQGDTPAPAGDYYARTVVGKSADRQLGADRILTPQDAAQATAYLYRSAVERFDAIVTDKDGKPLAVVGNFKGAVSQTSVYPATVVGEAVRVPGAARIWFSHNHPSGVASLSSSDKALNQTLADVFRGSGIEPMGILAVTGDRFAFSGADGSTSTGEIPAPKKGVTVPVIERALKPASADRQQIENPQVALQMAGDLYKAAGSPGVMILDAQHRLAAWMPLPPVTRGNLRDTGGLNALYRGVSESNAGAAILVHGGELDARVGDGSVTASQNIAAALTKVDVRVLDSINAVTRESVAETVRTPEKGPVFSRTPATGRPTPQGPATVEMVQQVVDAITPAWAQRPEIVIAQSMQDPAVPEAVRNEDAAQRKRGATGVPSGFYYQGKVYLIADGVSSPRSVVETLYHEALGHHGLRSVFGYSLDGILDQIALARPELMRAKAKQYGKANTLAEVRAMVLKARPDLAGAALDSAAASRLQKHRREVAEEVLAEMAQTRPELGFVKRAIAAIRTWLRANLPGFEGMNLSDAEIIQNYILPARGWVERGERAMRPGGQVALLRAYHGTPHRGIQKFSTDFIGTGEGAQAYGWGLYFADKKEIAERYRMVLSSGYAPTVVKDGQELSAAADIAEAYYQIGDIHSGYGGNDKVLDFDRQDQYRWAVKVQEVDANGEPKYGTRPRWHSTMPDFKDLERRLKAKGYDIRRGQLYEVNIPEDSEMLLWDKPLSEQPEGVRRALSGYAPPSVESRVQEGFSRAEAEADYKKASRIFEGTLGKDFYGQGLPPSKAKERSLELAALGIKGIKYLDGTSRATGDGSYNYVIFSGDDVAIQQTFFSRTDQPFADIVAHFERYPTRPPSGMSNDDAKTYLRDRRASMEALVDAYVPRAEGLLMPVRGNGGFWGVTREARPDGDEWRVTRFDRNMEPQGHEAHRGARDAVADVLNWVDADRLSQASIFSRTQDQTQTPEFERWFGDSKVVDADGKPLLVYHGTGGERTVFEPYWKQLERDAMPHELKGNGSIAQMYQLAKEEPEMHFFAAERGTAESYGPDVVEAYLKIDNMVGDPSMDRDEAIQLMLDQDADGAIFRDTTSSGGYGGVAYVVRRSNQIKSAIGNRGTFDSENPDIRFSRSPATLGSNIPAWSAPEKAKWDDFVYKIQDRHVDLKRVTAQIKEVSGAIDDAKDTYLREEMYHSRVAKRIQDFINDELNPLVEDMRRTGVTMKAIERFMQARHAPEANAVIAQRNPGVPDLQDGGSGMTNAEAQAHMASLKPAERKHLESAAAKIDAIIKQTRQTLVDYELETQAVVDSWAQLFPNYVPLFREGHDDSFAPGIAQGFGVRGRETQSRTGSTAEVKDIFANIMMQRERAITRGEKNRVGQSLVALAESNPNADWWQVDSAPTKRVYDHKLGVVVNKPDLRWKERPNAVVVKFKNKAGLIVERAVVFNDKNERAKRMAAAMKSLDLDPLQGVMGIMASVTRYFAMINTQYNPVFGPFNMLRDIKAAMIQVDGTPIEKDRGKILSGVVPAIAGIYLSARKERKGKHQHGIWAGRWDEFQKVGGPTGFRAMFETSEDRAHDIRATMNPDWWTQEWWGKAITVGGILEGPLKPAKRGMVWVLDWLSDYNLALENGVRLAAYQAAIDRGQSKERAASLAKNLTINFNRRGQVGLQAGALYAFFNSAIQGTARMGETLTQMEPGKPKSLRLNSWGRKVVYGGLLLGAMQALAMAAAGFDDEDPPQFIRDRSLIIPLGNGRFWSQPLPLGYHVIPAIGRSITEFVLGGFQDPEERVMHVMELMLNAFNPLGHSGLSIQTIAPTPIDPLVALGENRDWTGRQIAQKSMNPATPGTEMASDQTMVLWRWMAAAINRLTGGNEFVAGGISPNPDQFSYLFGQITGGVGREAERAWQTGTAIVTGDEVATHRIPMVGRFVGSTRQQASKAATFRGHVQELNRLETEIRGLREAGRMDEARALRDSRPEARLITAANSTETRIRTLRNKRSELIQAGASREEVRAMNERITAEMLRFNEAMAKLKQPEQELVGE